MTRNAVRDERELVRTVIVIYTIVAVIGIALSALHGVAILQAHHVTR